MEIVQRIKKTGTSEKMTKREFIWLFDYYEKRTSGNVWRINEFLEKEKLTVIPGYQKGWIDDTIELKLKERAKIKNGNETALSETFDPINRLSLLKAASREPMSVKKESNIDKAYFKMWTNDFSQLPVMNDDREVLGIITWKSIAKGLIANKSSKCVKDFMIDEFTILDENKPLFNAIKQVINVGVVFVRDKNKKIKGPITPFDLNEQFIEQIEPYLLLEQIENYIRLLLHNKIILEDIQRLINIDDEEREISSLSDMNFGEYILVMQNKEMWRLLELPFDKADFEKDLENVRNIRNGVMHFHPDRIRVEDLNVLRKVSRFLMDFMKNI